MEARQTLLSKLESEHAQVTREREKVQAEVVDMKTQVCYGVSNADHVQLILGVSCS